MAPAPLPPARKSRTGLIVGIVAGVVVLVLIAGVSFLLVARGLGNRTVATAPTTTPSPTPTTPPPVSPEAYQTALDQVDQQLGPKFAAMVAAKHPADLKTTASDLSTAILGQVTSLTAIAPPTPAAQAHQDLTAGLTAFASAVESAGNTTTGSLCGGPSALSYLSQSSGADRLRTAITELAGADSAHPYKVGAFLPAKTPDPNRTLANGAKIKQAKSSSSNRLTVKNETAQDVVVSLTIGSSTTATLMFYVTAKQTATYVGIANNTYDVWYTTGIDWDSGTKAFTRSCAYMHDVSTLAFAETSTKYDVWTVTLTSNLFWRDDANSFPT